MQIVFSCTTRLLWYFASNMWILKNLLPGFRSRPMEVDGWKRARALIHFHFLEKDLNQTLVNYLAPWTWILEVHYFKLTHVCFTRNISEIIAYFLFFCLFWSSWPVNYHRTFCMKSLKSLNLYNLLIRFKLI